MTAAALVSGHGLLSDWLLLIAAVLFVVDVVAIVLDRTTPARGVLVAAGLALVALALLVV